MLILRYLLNYLFIKDIAVIVDLFKYKSVERGVFYHCNNDRTILHMHKVLNDNNIRMCSKRVDLNTMHHTFHITSHEKFGIIVNTSCNGWLNIFNSIENKQEFKNPFVWIIMTESLAQTVNTLSLYKIKLDSDVTLISKQDNIYTLYEIYHTGFNRNGQFIVQEVGQWNGALQFAAKDRKDLKGLVLKSAVVILRSQRVGKKTFVRYLDEEQPDLVKTDPVNKFKCFVVLKYFRDMFNNTFKFIRTSSWGYHTNGTFDGLVGTLQRMEADIGGSPLFIRADRMDALDYVVQAWQTKPHFIFRHPKVPGSWYSVYTRPLQPSVWWCVISILVLFAVVLAALLHLKIHRPVGTPRTDVSPSCALLVIWSAICQQGVTISRSSNSVKMLTLSIFMFAVMFYQYYNATVLFTLLQEQPKNIKTLKDLLASDLKAGVEDILYNKDFFKRTTDPIAREIYQKKVVHTTPYNYFSVDEGMALVKRGGFAFHIDSAIAYRNIKRTFSEKELCELQEVTVFSPHMSLVVAKGSPYKELIAFGVRRLTETGIITRLSSLWDERRPACVRTPDSSIISVSLSEFSAALAVIPLGAAAALTLFLAELLAARLGRRHVSRTTQKQRRLRLKLGRIH